MNEDEVSPEDSAKNLPLEVRVAVPPPRPLPRRNTFHCLNTLEEYEEEYCRFLFDESLDEDNHFRYKQFRIHEKDPEKRLQFREWFESKDCRNARDSVFNRKRRSRSESNRIAGIINLVATASAEEVFSESLYARSVEEIKNAREIIGFMVSKAVRKRDITKLIQDLKAAVEYPKNYTRSLDAFSAINRFVQIEERLPTGAPELQKYMADRKMRGREMTSENLQKELKKLGFYPL
jgi:hypothetical protein